MILFDWGIYNALNTLPKAAMLCMRLTEIPPWDFSRRMRGREYFGSYRDFAGKAFTTITAHAPYYNLVSDSLCKNSTVTFIGIRTSPCNSLLRHVYTEQRYIIKNLIANLIYPIASFDLLRNIPVSQEPQSLTSHSLYFKFS